MEEVREDEEQFEKRALEMEKEDVWFVRETSKTDPLPLCRCIESKVHV